MDSHACTKNISKERIKTNLTIRGDEPTASGEEPKAAHKKASNSIAIH
jgi:hypothetical protein